MHSSCMEDFTAAVGTPTRFPCRNIPFPAALRRTDGRDVEIRARMCFKNVLAGFLTPFAFQECAKGGEGHVCNYGDAALEVCEDITPGIIIIITHSLPIRMRSGVCLSDDFFHGFFLLIPILVDVLQRQINRTIIISGDFRPILLRFIERIFHSSSIDL